MGHWLFLYISCLSLFLIMCVYHDFYHELWYCKLTWSLFLLLPTGIRAVKLSWRQWNVLRTWPIWFFLLLIINLFILLHVYITVKIGHFLFFLYNVEWGSLFQVLFFWFFFRISWNVITIRWQVISLQFDKRNIWAWLSHGNKPKKKFFFLMHGYLRWLVF